MTFKKGNKHGQGWRRVFSEKAPQGKKERAEDRDIKIAIHLLNEHLEKHPDRDGNSVGYRIEQAITILKDAQVKCLSRR